MTRKKTDGDRRRLLDRISWLETELSHARRELVQLDLDSHEPRAEAHAEPATSTSTSTNTNTNTNTNEVNAQSSNIEKVALFLDRFVGRRDVYATRWISKKDGRAGWSPAVQNPFAKSEEPKYLRLTADVVARHLPCTFPPNTSASDKSKAEFHIGLYPMLQDNRCQLLVCDFDDGQWRKDAAAYSMQCTAAGIETLTEVSRSGEGAHVWMFFEEPVPAHLARKAGMALLRRTMAANPSISFASYDRFFPSQDELPLHSPKTSGRFGNLIALPLQGDCLRRGATEFADPATWIPYEDQFAVLSRVCLVPIAKLKELAKVADDSRVGPSETLPPRPRRAEVRKGARQRAGQVINLRLDSQVHVPTKGLPGILITELKHLASIANPAFFLKQAQRQSTYGTPRYITCFEYDDDELRLPRGLLDESSQRLEEAGFTVKVKKPRRKRGRIEFKFTGEARPDQRLAVNAMLRHDTGVLVASPGAGKTVMACALIAERQTPTAVLVHRSELLAQWRRQLSQFLDIDENQIGQLGAGRRKRKGKIDLIMMQSIAHRNGDPTILDEYGQIIIDECHAVAGPATEAALRQVKIKYWTGLTATPYRSDQLDGLITMQCGPIRHQMQNVDDTPRELRVHETTFTTEELGDNGPSIQASYTDLVHDEKRNRQVIDDVISAVKEHRHCLVLTARLDHLEILAKGISELTNVPVLVLHGRLKPSVRRDVRAKLVELTGSGEPFVLAAMDKVAGEGLDLPTLDTLFLAIPISFRGRVLQQIGRITRGRSLNNVTHGSGDPDTSSTPAIVHDYHDSQVTLFDNMYRKRRRVILRQGFVE